MTGYYASFGNDPCCAYEGVEVKVTEGGYLFRGDRIKTVYCRNRKTPFDEFFDMLSRDYQSKICEKLSGNCEWHPLQEHMDFRAPPRWLVEMGSLMLTIFSFGKNCLDYDAFVQMVMTEGYYDTGIRKREEFYIPTHRLEEIRFHDDLGSIITNPVG